MRVSNRQALGTMTEVVVRQAVEITKLRKHLTDALYERREYRKRWLELKEKEDGQ